MQSLSTVRIAALSGLAAANKPSRVPVGGIFIHLADGPCCESDTLVLLLQNIEKHRDSMRAVTPLFQRGQRAVIVVIYTD